MENVLLLDIDGTLFDPDKFGKLLRQAFAKILGVEEEEIIRANADYYAGLESHADFDPHKITEHLALEFGGDKLALDNVFWQNNEIYKQSLFPETVEFLKKSSKTHTLGIFSQGNEELQKRKLAASGILGFFDDKLVFIYPRKLTDEALALLPRQATLIDNHHDVALSLSKYLNIVWVNRKTEDLDPQIKTVHDLSEVDQ